MTGTTMFRSEVEIPLATAASGTGCRNSKLRPTQRGPANRASAAAIVLALAGAFEAHSEVQSLDQARDRVNFLTDPDFDDWLVSVLRSRTSQDPWAPEALKTGAYWRCSAILLFQGYLFERVDLSPSMIGGFYISDLVEGAQTLADLEPFFEPSLQAINRLSQTGGAS